MSDMWNNNPNELSDTPVDPNASVQPEEVAQVEVPAQPEQPIQPQTPPMNGFAPDGSYRYIPPREVPPSYQPPSQPSYSPQPDPIAPTPPPRKNKERGWVVVVAILAALAVLISAMSFIFIWLDKQAEPENEETSQSEQENTDDTDEGDTNAPTVEQKPADAPEDVDPEQDYYYGDGGWSTETIVNKNYNSTVVLTMYMKSVHHYFGESALQEVGAASGIVWTEDGYIITNYHCVINESTGEKYDRIDVTTYDGTVYEDVEVKGADEATDLAVIKIKKVSGLTPAVFGDSDDLAVGSRVVALGNAAGLSWTATQGIVSAKARDVYEDTGYAIKCLQVDVPINSGNSGGPLLNKYGQVVAINSAKIAASGYEGLGFSIPINEAKPVLESLAKYGFVKGRVALGITGQTIDNGYYRGFMIVEILDGSCLEDTEAQEYDLIVAVDDVEVVDYGTLRAELAKHKVGDTVTLQLLRSDARTGEVTTHTVEVKLKEQTAN